MRSFHSEMRTRRLLAGFSLKKAGALIGMSEAMLSLMERDKRKTKPEIRRQLLAVYEIKT